MWSVGDRDDDGVWRWQARVAGRRGGTREGGKLGLTLV